MIVALIALGGVVAVEGLPGSSHSALAENVLVQNEVPTAEVSVASRTGPGRRAQSQTRPDRNSRAKQRKAASRGSNESFGDTAVSNPQPEQPADVPSDVPSLTLPPAPTPSPPDKPPHHNPPMPPPPPHLPVPVPSGNGPVGGLVGVVNETVHGTTGVDPHLPGTITPVTDPVDEIITGLTGGKGGLPPLP